MPDRVIVVVGGWPGGEEKVGRFLLASGARWGQEFCEVDGGVNDNAVAIVLLTGESVS